MICTMHIPLDDICYVRCLFGVSKYHFDNALPSTYCAILVISALCSRYPFFVPRYCLAGFFVMEMDAHGRRWQSI